MLQGFLVGAETLFRVGRRSDELGQAQDRRVTPCFAVHFIHARPREMAFVGRRFLEGQKNFHLNAIGQAVKRNVARSAGDMQAETMAAHRKNGGLQFENQIVGQPGTVSQKTRHTAHRGGQALIGVHAQAEVQGVAEHC